MQSFRTGQKGSVLMLMAITIPFLFALTAIGVDFGYLYTQRAKMQNVADAAALAGAAKLSTSTDAAEKLANDYITKNNVTAGASISFPASNKIRVDITRASPLLFLPIVKNFPLFNAIDIDTVELAVYAVASGSSGGKSIFDYLAISGGTSGILNLGPGGGNTYYGDIHSNYQFHQGGGTNTVYGKISAPDPKTMWASKSSSFKHYDAAGNKNQGEKGSLVDISVENSGLSTLIQQIKKKKFHNGDFTDAGDFQQFGEGIYVAGKFKPSYTVNGKLDTTTVVIAEGDINFPGQNGSTISASNHISFCSLNGNIDFNFSGGTFRGILYAPNGNINLIMGGGTFIGSIVGKTVTLGYGATTLKHGDFGIGGGTSKPKLIE